MARTRLYAALHSHWLQGGVVAVLVVSGVLAFWPRPSKYLDRLLGCTAVSGVEDQGFFPPEELRGFPFRWTSGSGNLVVPMGSTAPESMSLMLTTTADEQKALRVQVRVNGERLWDEVLPPLQWPVRRFSLAGVPHTNPMKIQIVSEAVVPGQANPKVKDGRSLGVGVLGIMLHSKQEEYVNVPLGGEPALGLLEESGFYYAEKEGEQPCRWTDGKARLVVPLGEARPQALSVALDVIGRPTPLTVSLNGTKLLEKELAPQLDWKQTFALAGINLQQKATIELLSDTWVPAELDSRSGDRRALGVRVKEIMLVGE